MVITIIAILASMLLPSLARAKSAALKVIDLNNLKQCGIIVQMYVDDWDRLCPTPMPTNGAEGFRNVDPGYDYDLRAVLQGYLTSFDIWGCNGVGHSPIDDPANTRSLCYGSFLYFPGRSFPEFGASGTSQRFSQLKARQVIMQCELMEYVSSGTWYFSHGNGDVMPLTPDNPSNKYMQWGLPEGSHLLFSDGSAQWYNLADLQACGKWESGAGVSDQVYSILPQ